MRGVDERLARAKAYLAIAESKDSKREAYKKAAEEIAAYKEATRATNAVIASELQLRRTQMGGEKYVSDLLKWRRTGYKAETPWLMDTEATTRAAASHAKKLLGDKGQAKRVEKILAELPDEAIERIEEAVSEEAVKRTVYADRPKPKHEDATRRQAAKRAGRLKANPSQAADSFVAMLGPVRARIRAVCQGYQDFLALVEDEEWRDYAREHLVTFQTDVNLALGEVLEGSIDDALARLLAGEEVK